MYFLKNYFNFPEIINTKVSNICCGTCAANSLAELISLHLFPGSHLAFQAASVFCPVSWAWSFDWSRTATCDGSTAKREALSVLALLRAVAMMTADAQSACCVQVLIHPHGPPLPTAQQTHWRLTKARLRALENLARGHIARYWNRLTQDGYRGLGLPPWQQPSCGPRAQAEFQQGVPNPCERRWS